jgi:phosphoglycerate dehydrogenase-like enzyme
VTDSILILCEDAVELAELVLADSDFAVTTAHDEREAMDVYAGESILFGSPLLIAGVIEKMPDVRWVQSTWAGVTPLLELKRRDYVLTGIKGIFGPQMSEYVIGHLLAIELRVSERLREQQEHQWFAEPSGTLHGKRMGIMGTGSIGQAIAEQAASFGVTVTGLSRSGRPASGFNAVCAADQINEFLPNLDYLVAVLPHTPETDELLNAAALALLPSHAILVNVGRANVINDDALVAALSNGSLGGAVLDVFDQEPIPDESPLWDTPNLVITAHMAAVSHPELIVPIFLENYERFMAGQTLLHAIDFDQGY